MVTMPAACSVDRVHGKEQGLGGMRHCCSANALDTLGSCCYPVLSRASPQQRFSMLRESLRDLLSMAGLAQSHCHRGGPGADKTCWEHVPPVDTMAAHTNVLPQAHTTHTDVLFQTHTHKHKHASTNMYSTQTQKYIYKHTHIHKHRCVSTNTHMTHIHNAHTYANLPSHVHTHTYNTHT